MRLLCSDRLNGKPAHGSLREATGVAPLADLIVGEFLVVNQALLALGHVGAVGGFTLIHHEVQRVHPLVVRAAVTHPPVS